MKKLVLLFSVLFSIISANAQFKATPNGFATEEGKDFYVAPIEGKNAMDLYKGVKSYIISKYQNPDIVSNDMEGEMINIHFIDDNAFPVSLGLGLKTSATIDMNIVMKFRDGRMRFDAPMMNELKTPQTMASKEMVYRFSGGAGKLVGETSLFNKKGKTKDDKIIESLENYVNSMINEIIESAKGSEEEDW